MKNLHFLCLPPTSFRRVFFSSLTSLLIRLRLLLSAALGSWLRCQSVFFPLAAALQAEVTRVKPARRHADAVTRVNQAAGLSDTGANSVCVFEREKRFLFSPPLFFPVMSRQRTFYFSAWRRLSWKHRQKRRMWASV